MATCDYCNIRKNSNLKGSFQSFTPPRTDSSMSSNVSSSISPSSSVKISVYSSKVKKRKLTVTPNVSPKGNFKVGNVGNTNYDVEDRRKYEEENEFDKEDEDDVFDILAYKNMKKQFLSCKF